MTGVGAFLNGKWEVRRAVGPPRVCLLTSFDTHSCVTKGIIRSPIHTHWCSGNDVLLFFFPFSIIQSQSSSLLRKQPNAVVTVEKGAHVPFHPALADVSDQTKRAFSAVAANAIASKLEAKAKPMGFRRS